ncbi:GNAT family N-acetyltransferase [Stagnihabitans tardus]|uniref:GNAT family N-acetyltransferase n=1 Tax=Stagnihabitans tardus TaxID=2699202 RepID=A0AAE5BSW1_9RHOB|nr:GNAT family N-acetyltransferase [Stagnihabitans tardus]NBZ88340.1 GNAT family N-acetyltransferase [Stagnihabitans tardus]
MPIRSLDPAADRDAILGLLTEARDYYQLWLGRDPVAEDVEEMLTAGPPGCDPAVSHRLGLWGEGLEGVAELSFGFPSAEDAYLGLMILAPRARSRGQGADFLAHVEGLARGRGCPRLYLAVLEANPRGRAFWERMGFGPTGVMREMEENGILHRVHRLVKTL